MTDLKRLALDFLKECAEGRAEAAFKERATPGVKHHNVYFPADAASLAGGMDDNARTFPNKTFEPQRALQDGAQVAVHSRFVMQDMVISVVHLFRFEGDKVAELWDVAMPVPEDSPNQSGPF